VRDTVQGNGREGLKGEGGDVLGGDLEGTEEGGERVVMDLSVETFERCRRKPSRPRTARTNKLYMGHTVTRYPRSIDSWKHLLNIRDRLGSGHIIPLGCLGCNGTFTTYPAIDVIP